MPKRRAALILASGSIADQINGWLQNCGVPASEIDQIHVPRESVNVLRAHSYGLVFTPQTLDDVSGYRWYQALRILAPNSKVLFFAQGEGEHPALNMAQTKDTQLVYLPAGITEEDVARHAQAFSQPEPSHPKNSVPTLDDERYQSCEQVLSTLATNVGAHNVYLVNHLGQVLVRKGDAKTDGIGEVGSLLGGGFAALLEVGQVLGEGDTATNLIYRQGEQDDMCALSVGTNFFLLLFIPHVPYASKMGTVWYFAQEAAKALKEVMADFEGAPSQLMLDGEITDYLDSQLDSLLHSPSMTRSAATSTGMLSLDEAFGLEEAIKKGLISEDFANRN